MNVTNKLNKKILGTKLDRQSHSGSNLQRGKDSLLSLLHQENEVSDALLTKVWDGYEKAMKLLKEKVQETYLVDQVQC